MGHFESHRRTLKRRVTRIFKKGKVWLKKKLTDLYYKISRTDPPDTDTEQEELREKK